MFAQLIRVKETTTIKCFTNEIIKLSNVALFPSSDVQVWRTQIALLYFRHLDENVLIVELNRKTLCAYSCNIVFRRHSTVSFTSTLGDVYIIGEVLQEHTAPLYQPVLCPQIQPITPISNQPVLYSKSKSHISPQNQPILSSQIQPNTPVQNQPVLFPKVKPPISPQNKPILCPRIKPHQPTQESKENVVQSIQEMHTISAKDMRPIPQGERKSKRQVVAAKQKTVEAQQKNLSSFGALLNNIASEDDDDDDGEYSAQSSSSDESDSSSLQQTEKSSPPFSSSQQKDTANVSLSTVEFAKEQRLQPQMQVAKQAAQNRIGSYRMPTRIPTFD